MHTAENVMKSHDKCKFFSTLEYLHETVWVALESFHVIKQMNHRWVLNIKKRKGRKSFQALIWRPTSMNTKLLQKITVSAVMEEGDKTPQLWVHSSCSIAQKQQRSEAQSNFTPALHQLPSIGLIITTLPELIHTSPAAHCFLIL